MSGGRTVIDEDKHGEEGSTPESTHCASLEDLEHLFPANPRPERRPRRGLLLCLLLRLEVNAQGRCDAGTDAFRARDEERGFIALDEGSTLEEEGWEEVQGGVDRKRSLEDETKPSDEVREVAIVRGLKESPA